MPGDKRTGADHKLQRLNLLVLPALNQMIDVTTSRAIAALTHTPTLFMILLAILGLVCSLLAGYDNPGRGTSLIELHQVAVAIR